MGLRGVGQCSTVQPLLRDVSGLAVSLSLYQQLLLVLIGNEMAIQVLEKMTYDTYKIGEHAVVRAFVAIALGVWKAAPPG